MKKIVLIEANLEQVDAAFDEANGKAKASVLCGKSAFTASHEAEAKLADRGIPKSKRKGARAHYVPSGPALAYRYPMRTTAFVIERGAKCWHLVSVSAVNVRPRTAGGLSLSITADQAEIVKKNALHGLHVLSRP